MGVLERAGPWYWRSCWQSAPPPAAPCRPAARQSAPALRPPSSAARSAGCPLWLWITELSRHQPLVLQAQLQQLRLQLAPLLRNPRLLLLLLLVQPQLLPLQIRPPVGQFLVQLGLAKSCSPRSACRAPTPGAPAPCAGFGKCSSAIGAGGGAAGDGAGALDSQWPLSWLPSGRRLHRRRHRRRRRGLVRGAGRVTGHATSISPARTVPPATKNRL